MRKIFLITFLCLFARVWAADVYIDGIYYNLKSSDKTAEVTYGADKYQGTIEYQGVIVIPSSVVNNGITYNVTSIDFLAFYNCTGLTSVTIPNSVATIYCSAFEGCTGLTNVTIPNSVTYIDDSAFKGCAGLTNITIPASVTSIGGGAFDGCTGLISIDVSDENAEYSSMDGVLYNKDKSDLIQYPASKPNTSFTIPNSVTSIGGGAFKNCKGLTNITIPNSVIYILGTAFYGCTGLTSLTIPNSVIGIWREAFYGCTGLTSLTIPSSVTGIDVMAFEKCINLQDLYILSSNVELGVLGRGFLGECNTVYAYRNILDKIGESGFMLSYQRKVEITNPYFAVEIRSISPSVVTFRVKELACDENVTFARVECIINGRKYEGNDITITGLEPNKEYTIAYTVKTNQGISETVTKTIITGNLELTTLQPKGVSERCSIVAATTNISEEEPNVGFQWKKYDAPASLAPSEGYAAIYNGQIEGYIRNLQPTSYYNVRAFYKSEAGNYYYGDWVTFDPSEFSYFEPTVHTYEAMEIGSSSAKVKGYVLAGTDNIIEQGFEYWAAGALQSKALRVPATMASDVTTVLSTGQVMTVTLTNLQPNTTYHFRSFVKTTSGTTYGEEQILTTDYDTTGIGSVGETTSEPVVVGYYDLNGRRLDGIGTGITILRYSDGSTRKVVRR